jgi:ABC-type transport system involved in resistance to organic solvents, periplasmic component
METKPNTFLVGAFVLMLVAIGIVFVLWVSKVDFKDAGAIYQINFEGPVTGLRVNENVLYQGIPIGKVKKIKIDRDDAASIKVFVSIAKPYLIRENSVASIEAQGLTGNTFVQIRGTTKESRQLQRQPGNKYPVIQSKRSSIDTLFSEAPLILEKLSRVTTQLEKLFNDEMIQNTARTMQNLGRITQTLSEGPHSLKNFVHDARKAFCKFDQASSSLHTFLQENRPAIHTFTETGLPALIRMSQQLETSATHIERVVREIEKSPVAFLTKDTNQGIKLND